MAETIRYDIRGREIMKTTLQRSMIIPQNYIITEA
jgi:hypothetical protein